MEDPIAQLRREYTRGGLDLPQLNSDPVVQFRLWLEQALSAGVPEPNAMTLATASAAGVPSARLVLLKGVDQRGFTFYTSYLSPKAAQLQENPQAALVFFWPELERQVRITGSVKRTSRAQAREYFASRPRNSQLGAWASRQSHVVADRAFLEQQLATLAQKYPGPVPCPPWWGGFRLQHQSIEFWQGRPSRLHDRLRYTRTGGNTFVIDRLSP